MELGELLQLPVILMGDTSGSMNEHFNDDHSTGGDGSDLFQSGAGLLTARDFQLQPGSAFTEMCQEAGEVLKRIEKNGDLFEPVLKLQQEAPKLK